MHLPKYSPHTFGLNTPPHVDGGQYAMANKSKFIIYMSSVAMPDLTVGFQAFVTKYSEKFSSKWNPTSVYGRNDAIQTFSQTTRQITLGWDIPANSLLESKENMIRCQKVVQMLYPIYDSVADSVGALAIKTAPLVKLRFVNLIREAGASSIPTGHLIGTISDFEFAPNDFAEQGIMSSGVGDVYPRSIKVSISFTVLHTHDLGHISAGKTAHSRSPDFPWGETDAATQAKRDAEAASALEEAERERQLKILRGGKTPTAAAKTTPKARYKAKAGSAVLAGKLLTKKKSLAKKTKEGSPSNPVAGPSVDWGVLGGL